MRVPTLSALGRALTCNRSGKQPLADLGRGRKGGEGERRAAADPARDRSQLSSQLPAGQCSGHPGGRGWPAGEESGWRLLPPESESCWGPVSCWTGCGAVGLEGYGLGGEEGELSWQSTRQRWPLPPSPLYTVAHVLSPRAVSQ